MSPRHTWPGGGAMCVVGVRAGCGPRWRYDPVVRGNECAGWLDLLRQINRESLRGKALHLVCGNYAPFRRHSKVTECLGGIRVSICTSRQTPLPGSTWPNGSSAVSPRGGLVRGVFHGVPPESLPRQSVVWFEEKRSATLVMP
jgi:hypothetical protein